MRGALIAFTVSTGSDRTRSSAFAKRFYGQETSTQQGRYRYRRHGLLDDIPHIKLIRGVIIVRTEDVEQVTLFMKRYSATYHVRIVELTDEDHIALDMPTE
jgi:hypothetical protein